MSACSLCHDLPSFALQSTLIFVFCSDCFIGALICLSMIRQLSLEADADVYTLEIECNTLLVFSRVCPEEIIPLWNLYCLFASMVKRVHVMFSLLISKCDINFCF